jgi:hypothetical protein
VHLKVSKPTTLEAAYCRAQDVDPVTYKEAEPKRQRGPPFGAHGAHAGARTPRGPSPAPFSRSPSVSREFSRERSAPPGTPVNAVRKLKALLASLGQDDHDDEDFEDDYSNDGLAAVDSSNPINWAKAGVKWVEGRRSILKMDDAQRQYCRERGICFRCRGKSCPIGNCKNPPPHRAANSIEDAESLNG